MVMQEEMTLNSCESSTHNTNTQKYICLRACLPAFLHARLLACLLACLPVRIVSWLSACLPLSACLTVCLHPFACAFIHASRDPINHSSLPFHHSFIIYIAILPPSYLFRHIKDCLTRTTLLICPGSAQDHRAREHRIQPCNPTLFPVQAQESD